MVSQRHSQRLMAILSDSPPSRPNQLVIPLQIDLTRGLCPRAVASAITTLSLLLNQLILGLGPPYYNFSSGALRAPVITCISRFTTYILLLCDNFPAAKPAKSRPMPPPLLSLQMLLPALLGASLALPPQMEQVLRARSSQQVLGLTGIMIDRSSIKRAHRALAKACHPDRHCWDPDTALCASAHRATVLINGARDDLLGKVAWHGSAWEKPSAWEEPPVKPWEQPPPDWPQLVVMIGLVVLMLWLSPRREARSRRLESKRSTSSLRRLWAH